MRVHAIFDDLLQPHRIEEHRIVQIGRVRANLKKIGTKEKPKPSKIFVFNQ